MATPTRSPARRLLTPLRTVFELTQLERARDRDLGEGAAELPTMQHGHHCPIGGSIDIDNPAD